MSWSSADVQQFILKNFLILGLITVIPLALLLPSPGVAIGALHYSFLNPVRLAIVIIFLVSGLSLGSIKECWEVKALGLALVLILLVTPFLILPVLGLRDSGLLSSHFAHGLAVFCAVPTTLSSGVVMVSQSQGNAPLAILITTTANTIGVLTLPITVFYIFKSSIDVSMLEMFRDLLCTVLCPLAFGMLFQRAVPFVADFVKIHKPKFTVLNNSCILFSVWVTVCAAQQSIEKTPMVTLLCLVLCGVVLHIVKLVMSFGVTTALGIGERSRRTLILMCSQKSLPVSISVLAALPQELQKYVGLMAIPCVVGHATQLLMDAYLVNVWAATPLPEEQVALTKKQEPVPITPDSNPQDSSKYP